jgi:hypothetical protein
MTAPTWKPWHKVVQLRDDLRSGEMSLALFAADIYDVMMRTGRRPQYEDPSQFFALTYPTYNLRQLARDVVRRLAGQNDKAVRQLELTYGGGKTHTLITLYHLVNDPEHLPELPAVQEFIQTIGMRPPKARLAVLAFDKLDVEKGTEVLGPRGERRWLRQPWSVLAFQIAGEDGLRLLHTGGEAVERESAPAENLLTELLSLPAREDLATLVLIDEVLMYAREKVGLDPAWRGRLANFFQYLTQSATRVDRCAIVASLLATDPAKSDALGKELTHELYAIFRRELEEGVQPVVKEDVAEVLRRRFFTPASIANHEAFRANVVAAVAGIAAIDEQTRKQQSAAEERFLNSYPFHPDLTEVFYSKWTNLEGFQRTRGVLRTFALALREAEKWDDGPMVGVNVFLGRPGETEISEAARELTTIARTEEYEGKRQDWAAILQGELGKAKEIQRQSGALHHREVEQAVFATFLHSQPIGQKALTRDLFLLLGPTHPDKIELEKALHRWTEVSWFLDDTAVGEAEAAMGGAEGGQKLPKSWRLGSKPNLVQMHSDACDHVADELIEAKLHSEIGKLKSLTAGAAALGARVHNLPEKPSDIADDGDFHYAVLGPLAASEAGSPSERARRFLDESTGPDRPRVYRNAVVLVVPSSSGLEAAREAVRRYLGWEEVSEQLAKQPVDPIRAQLLANYRDAARRAVPEAISQAYCIVVTIDQNNQAAAFRITVGKEPLFQTIKADARARIQETQINAEALLPEGPYDLWRQGETARRVKDLIGAFAQLPHLPKMLNSKAILDTLVGGCKQGLFVLRLARPDHSLRTFWRQIPDEVSLREPGLEAVLPQVAVLAELAPELLAPGRLPGLWPAAEISVADVYAYFSGRHVVKLQEAGYEEQLPIPKADPVVVSQAIRTAVKSGWLWLTSGQASLLSEDIPAGILTGEARLQAPPDPIPATSILPEALPAACEGQMTTALAIAVALSAKEGKVLPWATVRDAIDGALKARLLERSMDSGPWPCDYAGAGAVKLRRAAQVMPSPVSPAPAGVLMAEADLTAAQVQDLADQIGEITKAAAGVGLKLRLKVELGGAAKPSSAVVEEVSKLLQQVSADLKLG